MECLVHFSLSSCHNQIFNSSLRIVVEILARISYTGNHHRRVLQRGIEGNESDLVNA